MRTLAALLVVTVPLVSCTGSDVPPPVTPAPEAPIPGEPPSAPDEGTEGDRDGNPEALRRTLSQAMATGRVLPYDAAWDVLSDAFAVGPGQVRLFYTERVIPAENRASGENQSERDFWNREHVWPQSHGLADNDARTDLHNLVPVDQTVNSSRGNRVFDDAPTPHHECEVCRAGGGVFMPGPEERGDVARIAFYMDVRYEGQGGVPDLVLADDVESDAARFGVLSTLLRWHCADPVSGDEVVRHEIVAEAQGNRNVFVDRPELANALYGVECGEGR